MRLSYKVGLTLYIFRNGDQQTKLIELSVHTDLRFSRFRGIEAFSELRPAEVFIKLLIVFKFNDNDQTTLFTIGNIFFLPCIM